MLSLYASLRRYYPDQVIRDRIRRLSQMAPLAVVCLFVMDKHTLVEVSCQCIYFRT